MRDINIEKLKYKDLEDYKALIDECFGGSQELEYYEKCYNENKNYEIIVAKLGDIIIGSATMVKIDLFTFSFQPVIELFNVVVSSNNRQNKVGTLLIDYVKKYAMKNGYNQVILTCLEDVEYIHKFYERVGFTKANSRKYVMDINRV